MLHLHPRMTHSVNGDIVYPEKITDYNPKTINELVIEFGKRFNILESKYVKDIQLTQYWRKDKPEGFRRQPLIDVFDEPKRLYRWLCNLEKSSLGRNMYLLIRVESGSHVSIRDTIYAQEIYDATMNLKGLIQRELSLIPSLMVLFDDEHQLYLPTDFKRRIKKASTIT